MSSSGRLRPILIGTALCLLPTILALALLVTGVLMTDLTLVYASIAVSVLAVAALVGGVVLIVRAVTSP